MDARARVAEMGWDEFEGALRPPAAVRGAGRRQAAGDSAAVAEVFDEAELAELRALAASSARQRDRAPLAGNVIYLPGIMGSTLATRHVKGDEDLVWINFFRIANGLLARLRLSPDGKAEADPQFTVRAADVDKKTYAKAVLTLRARWDVRTCPFDWRKDIDASSDALRDLVVSAFPGKPVHLVAHSMGGLVARNFIRKHDDVWREMRGADGSGGRLVMLGTPNYGSFAIPQVLTGVEKMVRLLARADLRHDLLELLSITNSFVGSYQMLPSPDKGPPAVQAIYRRDTWGAVEVSADHLDRAARFHRDLAAAASRTIDPERMVYVAGFGRETINGLSVVAPGEFDYTVTHDGDGRVPHALGLLDGVPTYYADEGHGSLPGNRKILEAMDELLLHGRTSVLPTAPGAARFVRSAKSHWTRSTDERDAGDDLARTSQRVVRGRATADDERRAEEVLRRAALGTDRVAVPLAVPPDHAAVDFDEERRVGLAVAVAHGDVTRVDAPLLVLGYYKGVPPARALATVDKALDHAISKAMDRGMFAAGLGELFHMPAGTVPDARKWFTADSVLLAGMGSFGQFSRDDLRYLMANVATAAVLLRLGSFATVAVGAGSFSYDRVVRGVLEGVCDALQKLPRGERATLKRLTFVERDGEAVKEIMAALRVIQYDRSIPELDLEVGPAPERLPDPTVVVRAGPADTFPPPKAGVRITIARAGDEFEFSALTDNAVIPVRKVKVQQFFTDGTAERLMNAASRGDQEKFGRLLNTYLLPDDLLKQLSPGTALTVVVDRTTAGFPWEMACFKSARGYVFFGPALQLTRQFRTMLSANIGLPPPPENTLRVLVVADPAPEPELQLPGARLEGREVVRRLVAHRQRTGAKIEVVDRIGPGDCDPVEVLALVLSEEFDVIHFAGHGFFNEAEPDLGGWVFGRDRTLTAREIFRSRGRTPRLVFANACYSAVVNPKVSAVDVMNRQLAGLVEAFFDRGIANYIGTGWPVGDQAAVTFAATFYDQVLKGETLGVALSDARVAIMPLGSTWGAYQHYGQVHTRLAAPRAGAGGGGGGSGGDDGGASPASPQKAGAKGKVARRKPKPPPQQRRRRRKQK